MKPIPFVSTLALAFFAFTSQAIANECEFTASDNNSPKFISTGARYRYHSAGVFSAYWLSFGPYGSIDYEAIADTDPAIPCVLGAYTVAQYPYGLLIDRPEVTHFSLRVQAAARRVVPAPWMPWTCRYWGVCTRFGASYVAAAGVGEPALYSTYYTFVTLLF